MSKSLWSLRPATAWCSSLSVLYAGWRFCASFLSSRSWCDWVLQCLSQHRVGLCFSPFALYLSRLCLCSPFWTACLFVPPVCLFGSIFSWCLLAPSVISLILDHFPPFLFPLFFLLLLLLRCKAFDFPCISTTLLYSRLNNFVIII